MVVFAILGGFLGHVMRVLDSRHRVVWSRALFEAFAAGFVGVLVLLLCNAMGLSDQWTGVVVGVSGWLGANASIGMLSGIVLRRLGVAQNYGDEGIAYGPTRYVGANQKAAADGVPAPGDVLGGGGPVRGDVGGEEGRDG